MPAAELGALTLTAIAVTFVARVTYTELRGNCATAAILRTVVVLNVAAFVLLVTAVATLSWLAFGGGVALMSTNFFPQTIVRFAGGGDPLCLFRRHIFMIFGLLRVHPLTAEVLAEAEKLRGELEQFRSSETEPAIQAVASIFEHRFRDTDRAATLRAYDELDAAMAELKKKYNWGEPRTPIP